MITKTHIILLLIFFGLFGYSIAQEMDPVVEEEIVVEDNQQEVIEKEVVEQEKPFKDKIDQLQKDYYRENGKFKQFYDTGDGLEVHVYEMPGGIWGYKVIQNYPTYIEVVDKGPADTSGIYYRDTSKGVWETKYRINENL